MLSWGPDVGTDDPPQLGKATLAYRALLHQVRWASWCQLMPWLPCASVARDQARLGQEGAGPGPWGGGPAPQPAGDTASLGSRGESDL